MMVVSAYRRQPFQCILFGLGQGQPQMLDRIPAGAQRIAFRALPGERLVIPAVVPDLDHLKAKPGDHGFAGLFGAPFFDFDYWAHMSLYHAIPKRPNPSEVSVAPRLHVCNFSGMINLELEAIFKHGSAQVISEFIDA